MKVTHSLKMAHLLLDSGVIILYKIYGQMRRGAAGGCALFC